jgi:cytochrome c oxidase subunit 4
MNQASHQKKIIGATVALLAFLALTIWAAFWNLGPFNTVVAMSISVAKAALILLVFMDIRERGKLVWLALGTGFFWLAIMFALALSDFLTRGNSL